MNKKRFFSSLALQNIKKNGRFYFPYLLTVVATVAMYYIICGISYNEGIRTMPRATALVLILKMGANVTGIFSVVFLFYTNSFLIKRRKREFGLYHILGMEKRHVARVLFWENFFVCVTGIIVGIISGILLNLLLLKILMKITNLKTPIPFTVDTKAVVQTGILFAGIFFATFLYNEFQLAKTKAIDLLHSEKIGEREPKTKWVLAILGVAALAVGYYIAITTENPLAAIQLFFLAVVLVVVGTYFLFIAGSIAVLKLLRANKRYYYKPRHFIAVSSLLYRMKQNATGLASICILSTMVLVMISSTVCLNMGTDDMIARTHRYDMQVTQVVKDNFSEENLKKEVQNKIPAKYNVKDMDGILTLSFIGQEKGSQYVFGKNMWNMGNMNQLHSFFFYTAQDYEKYTGKKVSLQKQETLSYDIQKKCPKTYHMLGQTFTVKKYLQSFPMDSKADEVGGWNSHAIIVSDRQVLEELCKKVNKVSEQKVELTYSIRFNLDATPAQQIKLTSQLKSKQYEVEGKEEKRADFIATYGGFLFLGIFLGSIFLMATALTIYYKQISEGYDDKERYEIMQKVGMSKKEVRASIRSQILLVFFLPLITAAIHVMAAFPMIRRLLMLFGFFNTGLFIKCVLATVAVFAVVYTLVYTLTSKAYYKIVE